MTLASLTPSRRTVEAGRVELRGQDPAASAILLGWSHPRSREAVLAHARAAWASAIELDLSAPEPGTSRPPAAGAGPARAAGAIRPGPGPAALRASHSR